MLNRQKYLFPGAIIVVFILISCNSQKAINYQYQKPRIINTSFNMTNNSFDLNDLLAFTNLSKEEIRTRLSIAEENIEHNVKYEKLAQLTRFHNSNAHAGYFYFRDGKLVMLYIGKNELLEKLDPKTLQDKLGEEGIRLRSRAGKKFNHYVYPAKGVAFSADNQSVRFIEIFPPTTLEEYKAEIYEEPQPFIK
ncbi:hypothetical protein [Floridanema flaviceps]